MQTALASRHRSRASRYRSSHADGSTRSIAVGANPRRPSRAELSELLRAATIRDVAREANVSVTTVSHVFSAKRPVAEPTRERVLAAARTLAYAPNAQAHGLATGRSMTLGLHVGFAGSELMLNPFHALLLQGISTAALEHAYSFVLLPPGLPDPRSTLRRLIVDRRVDGMVLIDPDPSMHLHEDLAERETPFACVGRIVGAERHLWVDNDYAAAAQAVLEHLAAQGYERPALLGVRGRQSFVVDFERGYRAWCAGADVRPHVVWINALVEAQGYEAAVRTLAQPSRADALVCMHDRVAVGALRAAQDAGATVPGDVGIVGSTDTIFAAYASPPITSLQIFPDRLGAKAVDLVLRALDGEQVESAIVPTSVVARESTLRSSRPTDATATGQTDG